MANRHLARSIAMQSLFEWDFHQEMNTPVVLEDVVARNLEEFGPGLEDHEFTRELVHGVLDHQETLDTIIQKYAPEWPISQITRVDRNILRVGIFEIKLLPNVPSRVAINEAIELAKSFGGESSGRFVNGVLGALYNDMKTNNELKEADLVPSKKEQQEAESPEPEHATPDTEDLER